MARNKIASGPAGAKALPATLTPTAENPNPQLGGPENTIVERAADPTGDGKLGTAQMAGVRGGSFGVIPEAEKRVSFYGTHITGKGHKAPVAKQPKKFVVIGPINAPGGRVSFVYDHQRVSVMPGKEMSENAYDLDIIRKQGIKLEEVIDPLGEQEPILEAVEATDGEQDEDAEESADA